MTFYFGKSTIEIFNTPFLTIHQFKEITSVTYRKSLHMSAYVFFVAVCEVLV